ncbi:hypothetical protein [Streptomyces sp. NPDC001851]|uniref:hypothetical protein n=1 Tax=Streptomyces sp. NPDC001851 TaxID=3154529 RepID=UPI00332BE445
MKSRLTTPLRAAAALGLATAGIMGLGAGAAHADTLSCSDQMWSNYNTEYRICIDYIDYGHAVVKWAVNTTYHTTDERFYLQISGGCQNGYNANWNDISQWRQNVGQLAISCPAGEANGGIDAQLWPTERSSYSGPVAEA